jgi:hypothetical protein
MRRARGAEAALTDVVDGWVSPWGGGDGDDGDRKCAEEGHGGSVAGVDERWLTWPSAEESEGEKRRGE